MSLPASAEALPLDDLPKYSDWPKRIVGEEPWTVPDRNLEKIDEEYEQDKYAALKEFVKFSGETDPWDVKRCQNSNREWQFLEDEVEEETVCLSQDGELYSAPIHDAQRGNDKIVVDRFRDILNGTETVIELGSGYGYNLHLLNEEFPNCEFIGGEFSENAVEITSRLYDNEPNIRVEQFNYYNDSWPLLEQEFDTEVVLFTRLSIEQLPTCADVIETLRAYLPKIREGIHLEPVYELHDEDSLLNLLRKRYIEINDYNRDLLSVLEATDDIEIESTAYDIYGFNGLNPMSEIRWFPR